MRALRGSMGVAVAVSLLFLAFAPVTAPAQDPVAGRLGGSGPTVPVLFIPGYAAVRPKAGTILSFTLHRGAPPRTLDLSASYALLVRSLKNAGYREGKTFFGAVYDWRMASAPDDGLFDGTLELVTAPGDHAGHVRVRHQLCRVLARPGRAGQSRPRVRGRRHAPHGGHSGAGLHPEPGLRRRLCGPARRPPSSPQDSPSHPGGRRRTRGRSTRGDPGMPISRMS